MDNRADGVGLAYTSREKYAITPWKGLVGKEYEKPL